MYFWPTWRIAQQIQLVSTLLISIARKLCLVHHDRQRSERFVTVYLKISLDESESCVKVTTHVTTGAMMGESTLKARRMTADSTPSDSRILTPDQAVAVRNELDELLHSSQFSASSRCSALLAFVVNNALDGNFENLTERVLGTELFGRPHDYETGTDSIVRVRANDVRRRLAEHYAERQPASGVRIILRSGSYVPEFHWPAPEAPSALPEATHQKPPMSAAPRAEGAKHRFRKPVLAAAVLLMAASLLTLLWVRRAPPPDDALQQFWQPLIHNNSSVIMCFGNTTLFWPSAAVRHAIENNEQNFVIRPDGFTKTTDDIALEGDLLSAVSILHHLSREGVAAELRWPQEIATADLNQSNVIFIGAFNNPWSMSLNEGLRFSFKQVQSNSQSIWMIQDRASPNKNWSVTKDYPQNMSADYAIITRIFDRQGKRIEISVGGIGEFGTQAAGEFLTDESQMSAFAQVAPRGWEQRNLQIVLGMGIDGRKIVSPKILAINVW